MSIDVCKYKVRPLVCTEIEMVVMEKCKVSELTEQNITDEEKTAAASRTHSQRSRYVPARLEENDRRGHRMIYFFSLTLQAVLRHGVQRPRLHR